MSYFRNYPFLRYDFKNSGKVLVQDITQKIAYRAPILKNSEWFFEYQVKDGETPESIAAKLYDNSSYAWVVLEANNISNVYEDWPMSSEGLDEYIEEAYENPDEMKHCVNSLGQVVDKSWPANDRHVVTHRDYEIELNDEKRTIKLLMSRHLPAYVEQHEGNVSE